MEKVVVMDKGRLKRTVNILGMWILAVAVGVGIPVAVYKFGPCALAPLAAAFIIVAVMAAWQLADM